MAKGSDLIDFYGEFSSPCLPAHLFFLSSTLRESSPLDAGMGNPGLGVGEPRSGLWGVNREDRLLGGQRCVRMQGSRREVEQKW